MIKKTFTITLLITLGFTISACTIIDNLLNQTTEQDQVETVQQESLSDNNDNGLLENFSGRITELFNMQRTMQCTVTSQDEDGMNGKMYLSGNNIRADFTSDVDTPDGASTMQTYMISDGEWVYSWSDKLQTGMKMNISEFSQDDQDSPEVPGTPNLDSLNEEYDYECSDWTVDQSKFTLPSNINFVDATSIMQEFKGVGCQACNSLSDETQKQNCLSRLGC